MQDNWFLAIVLVVLNSIFLFAGTGAVMWSILSYREFKTAKQLRKDAETAKEAAELELNRLNLQINGEDFPRHRTVIPFD